MGRGQSFSFMTLSPHCLYQAQRDDCVLRISSTRQHFKTFPKENDRFCENHKTPRVPEWELQKYPNACSLGSQCAARRRCITHGSTRSNTELNSQFVWFHLGSTQSPNISPETRVSDPICNMNGATLELQTGWVVLSSVCSNLCY